MASIPPKPKRRWFQFSLRTLFILITLAAICLCWLTYNARQARQQWLGVNAVSGSGGSIRYSRLPFWPKWLVNAIGKDHFANVVEIEFLPHRSDGFLKCLKRLPNVRYLYLRNTNATDNDMENLKGLTSLRILDLTDTRITDAGLENLKGLTHLKQLYVGGTQVTITGINRLNQLLPNCEITQYKLRSIRNLAED